MIDLRNARRGHRATGACMLLSVLLLLPGCSSTHGRGGPSTGVGVDMILPPAATRMSVPDDRVFLMAAIVDNDLPVYPPVLLDRQIGHQSVCAEIVVGEEGNVLRVTPLYEMPECPDTERDTPPAFVQAVSDALSRWRFFAAATCSFPPGVPTNDACEGAGVKIEPVAIKLAYVFEFTNDEGKAGVSGSRKAGR